MVSAGFGMPPHRTVVGAWHVLRANQLWAPYPDNDPDGARRYMERFYRLVVARKEESFDPAEAARREGGGWGAHREPQHARAGGDARPLVDALPRLYAYVYSGPPESVH